MPKNKIIISLGVFVALLPVLGFPPAWESFFEVLAGLSIVGVSIWATIDKKLTQKAKAHKRQLRRRDDSHTSGIELEERRENLSTQPEDNFNNESPAF